MASNYEELKMLAEVAKQKENRLYQKYIAAKEAARVAAADAKNAQWPNEPVATGAVIQFVKFFGQQRRYDFAAIKSSTGKWSVTGRTAMTEITWAQLMEFIVKDEIDRHTALRNVKICASTMALSGCY